MAREMGEAIGLAPAIERVHRANLRLRGWGGLTLGAALSVIAVSLISDPVVDVPLVIALSVMLMLAEHGDRLFGDGTSISGSMVVAMAAVIVFERSQWLAAPMICSAAAGLYWPHLRTRALSRIAINAGSMSLAAGVAAVAFHTLAYGSKGGDVQFIIGGAVALSAFWLVNSSVLAVAVANIQGRSWLSVTLDLVRSDTALLPFAVGGLVAGLSIRSGNAWLGWLGLFATLAAVEVLVVGKGLNRLKRNAPAGAILIASLSLCAVAALSEPGLSSAVFAPVGLAILAIALLRHRPGVAHILALLCAVAAASSFDASASLIAPFAVGLGVCVADVVRARGRAVLGVASADALAAMAIGLVSSLLPRGGFSSSILGVLALGLACGVAALFAWHTAMAFALAADVGRSAWRAVLDFIRIDAGGFVLAGVFGSLCGWAGRSGGAISLAASLAVTCLALTVVATRPVRAPRALAGDADVLVHDVVQSALLDLPASKVPADL